MKLSKIRYRDLNARQKENYNFHIAASFLAKYGFNSIRLSDDWEGADFLAYHKDGHFTLKVQLKGRTAIYKKYEGKDLHRCFRIDDVWYLVPHDDLLDIVKATSPNTLTTRSWIKGSYSWPKTPKAIRKKLSDYALL